SSLVAGGGAVWKIGRLDLKADFGKSVGAYTYRQDFMELASRGLTINYDYRTGDVPSITLPANFDPTLRSSYP
ncbi:hypothetical protein, partial [Klebsiella aerogenes]|uniref:hypothetical protein n=1 Tax=Klebsiella aerogenes TaxID=548 RepID=UPI0013D24611